MSDLHDLLLPLPREEVIKAVERSSPRRVPLIQAHWWGEGLIETYGERLREFDRYPEDAAYLTLDLSNYSDWNLPWEIRLDGARDARCILKDWSRLDEFIAHLPEAEKDSRFDGLKAQAEQARGENRYLFIFWWSLFFERPWDLRGMRTLFTDYYQHPQEVHRLNDALCKMYLGYLRRAVRELHPDGFWTSDDLGHQKSLFLSLPMFREFLKPYYLRIGRFLHENHLHWWLHSCGNNTLVLGDLVEAGVDVFHPVQKGTMDEVAVARRFGGSLTFLAGVDVQHVLQEADPDGVRAEVRFLIDTFDRPDGGMCIAAGNGIVPGTPLENIEAFLDEAVRYGATHRAAYRRE
jgi:uroporphyrinogen decarboxylase